MYYIQTYFTLYNAQCLVIYLGPPKQPTNLGIIVIAPTILEANWTAIEDCDIVRYVVTVFIEGEKTSVANIVTNMTNCTINGLCPNTTYIVSVTAINNAGSSSSASMPMMTNGTGKLYITLLILLLLLVVHRKC